jgi:hypothetical protein
LKVQAIQPGFGWIYCDVSNECGPTTGQKIVEISSGRGLMINPNPADSYIDIDIDEEKMDALDLKPGSVCILTMVDKTGMVKYTDEFKEFPHRIYTSNLQEGLYIIKLVYEGKVFTIEVVIEH